MTAHTETIMKWAEVLARMGMQNGADELAVAAGALRNERVASVHGALEAAANIAEHGTRPEEVAAGIRALKEQVI